MRFEPAEMDQAYSAPRAPRSRGGGALVAACGCAGFWLAAIGAGAYAYFGPAALATLSLPVIAAVAAAAVGPAMLIVFAGLAAREAARARAESEHLSALAASALRGPSLEKAEAASALSRELKSEIAALDAIVGATHERLNRFQNALRQDGGVLAHALKQDLETMRSARTELRTEAEALGVAVNRNVKILRDATTYMKSETEAFGAVFAQIGARSAEFAAAAAASASSSEKFDAAVAAALDALAHATSLNDSARRSAVEAAEAAGDAARAVRETTGRAVAEARDAARAIRTAAASANSAESEPAPVHTGRHRRENIVPSRRIGAVALFRPKAEAAPLPANDADGHPVRTLADIVRLSGVRAAQALSPSDLARIARAGRAGPDARRHAVRTAAPAPLRKVSSHLRRDSSIRREAEWLRSQPSRALAADDTRTQHDLTSAYLLVDAALG